jgi:hypothetical protein
LNAGFQLKEEVMAQYMFPEKLDPSMSVQEASGVNGGRIFYRLSERLYEASGQLKFGNFFILRTHCLWDAVGILLRRIAECVESNDFAALRRQRKGRWSIPHVCVK